MKVRQLVEKLLKNWPAKVICFTLAVILYIFHQTSLYDSRSFVIPLSIIQDGIVMPVGNYPKNVTVTIRAAPEVVSSVHVNQISALINVNGITKTGDYSVPVNISLAPEIMIYDPLEIKVKPELINLKVEKKAVEYLKINPTIVGEPAHGYEIENISITPNFVEVSGPESVLKELEGLKTEKIDISNINADLNGSVYGLPISKVLKLEDEGPYQIEVKVKPQIMEKSFRNYKVQGINLSSDFRLISELPYVNLTLKGIIPLLETFNLNAYSVQVDLSGIKQAGKYELPLKFIYPSYFTLEEKSLEKITVEIEKIPVEIPEQEEEAAAEENETAVEENSHTGEKS